MEKWKETLLLYNHTVKDCVERLSTSSTPIALIIDESEKLLGTVTDSDIRKAILRNIPLESSVTEIMNPSPRVGKKRQSEAELDDYILKLGLRHLPIVDDDNRVVGLKVLSELHQKAGLPNSVLILAGGLGSRLGALTKECPKPMLTIEGIPLLEINIRKLKAQGFKKFYLSVNYLSHIIIQHLGDGSRLGVEIEYLQEKDRLGTAGPITLLPDEIKEPFLVLNGDIVTELNFRDLMYFHNISHHDITVCVRKHEFVIPYGVFDLEGTSVLKIKEKPTITKFINAGIYIMNPDILDHMEKGQSQGMNDLLNLAVKSGMDVECYTIKEYWKDVGNITDLEEARRDFKSLKHH